MHVRGIVLAMGVAVSLVVGSLPAKPQSQGVIVTVNDFPITRFDIEQRFRLLRILGANIEANDQTRRKALRAMIDELVQIDAGKTFKVNPTEAEVNRQIERMAKGMNTDVNGLAAKLKSQGIAMSTLRNYVTAQISFNRILVGKYKVDFKVDEAEIDAKFANIKQDMNKRMGEIMRDPRMKPVQVYELLQIDLPVENPQDSMLLQARAVEAGQYMSRFKGCKNAKAAASGIFNVKIGKKIEADASKLPPQMKSALDRAGPGKAVGPARGPAGIQVIAFCGKRTITPPKPKFELPTREQVAAAVSNEKFDKVSERYMVDLRKRALIDYKDPSYQLTE